MPVDDSGNQTQVLIYAASFIEPSFLSFTTHHKASIDINIALRISLDYHISLD